MSNEAKENSLRSEVSRLRRRNKIMLALSLLVVILASLIVLYPLLVNASITRVHGPDRNVGTYSSTLVVTLANTPTSGNTLVLIVGEWSSSSDYVVSSVVETNVVWTYAIRETRSGTLTEIWTGVPSASASTTVTITFSGYCYSFIADICEYSGLNNAALLDQTAVDTGLGTTLDTGTTATTTQASELFVGGLYVASASSCSQYAADPPYTLLDGASHTMMHYDSLGYVEYIAASKTTAYCETYANGGGSPGWCGAIVTLKAGATATAPTYTTIGSNSTVAGNPIECYVLWADTTGLSGFIFGTNNTGTFTNQTWTATVSGWGNYSFTLNSTIGHVTWEEWCNDTNSPSLWNNTGLQTITETDGTPPTYTTIGSNETIAGNPVICYTLWADNVATSKFIFGTNNTGTWTNQTAAALSSNWGNYTFTLNSTVGVKVQWEEWCNDTSNNWNNTGLQTITTIFYAAITVTTSTHTWTISPGQNNVTINENSGKIALSCTANAAFDVGAKANGDLTYGSNTISLTNTNMSATTWASAIPLTTSYQTVPGLSNVAAGTGLSENCYLWLSCPTNKPAGAYTETITFEIITHGGSY